MKKNILIIASILTIGLAKSQTLSDYKYVAVPQEFSDFKNTRSYGLTTLLEKSLKAKKYQVISDNKNSWPADAITNPCKVVNADLEDDKNMFRNKVILQFKDCNSVPVFTEKGNSGIKEFEEGFKDALKQTLVKIPVSNPVAVVEKPSETTVKETVKTTEETKVNANSSQTSAVQKYTNKNRTFQKIQIADDQFILIDGNSSVPFATFRSTAKKDVYRVKLNSGESTIGYVENGNITIEIPKSNGEFANEVFSAQ